MENKKLPNATAVLVLGILSVLTFCCYGVFGIIFGAVALFISRSDFALYKESPELYSNYQNLNIGRILAIVGVVLGVLFLLFIAWIINIVGVDALGNEDLMRERLQDFFGN